MDLGLGIELKSRGFGPLSIFRVSSHWEKMAMLRAHAHNRHDMFTDMLDYSTYQNVVCWRSSREIGADIDVATELDNEISGRKLLYSTLKTQKKGKNNRRGISLLYVALLLSITYAKVFAYVLKVKWVSR